MRRDKKIKLSESEALRISRRKFIELAGAGVVVVAAHGVLTPEAATAAAMPKVAIVRAPGLLKKNKKEQKAEFARMLDAGIKKITGKSADAGLKSIVPATDKVSMKVNSVGARQFATNAQLTYALADRLQDIGVKGGDIIIWDRTSNELRLAGYKVRKGKKSVRCFGTDDAGYTSKLLKLGEVKAKYSRILTDRTDSLINLPVLKTHASSGVSMALKNHYGSFDRPSDYHANDCDPFIADVNRISHIRDKTKLIVVDASRPQYDLGPMPVEEYRWDFEGIIVGADPVAVDAVGTDVINKKRRKSHDSRAEIKPYPRHIKTAHEKGLGEYRISKIKVYEIDL